MPNTNIVGRFSIFGTPAFFHSSMLRVMIISSFEVMSHATVSRIFAERVLINVSKNFMLR